MIAKFPMTGVTTYSVVNQLSKKLVFLEILKLNWKLQAWEFKSIKSWKNKNLIIT